MRITFVLPSAGLAGGIKVVAIYAERLKKRGHTVTVVSVPRRSLSFRQKIKYFLIEKKWPVTPEQESSHFDGVEVDHRILDKNRNITNDDLPDADIVIATLWITAEWISSMSDSKGKKVYFVQGKEADFPGLPSERIIKTYNFPFKKITISESLKKWLLTHTTDGISLILNSVDAKQFDAKKRNKQLIPSIGLLYSTSYIKGCDVSLRAIKIVKKMFPNIKIISFGFSSIDQKLPLPEEFEYWQQPPQNEIARIYSKCDVWLCGSRTEGFHLPPLEAMACRCPVVSTAVGGPLDIIQNGINGFVVPIDDYDQLAEALMKVLSLSNDDWIKMSNNAYQTAHAYTWDDATDLFEKALVEITER